MVRYESLDGIRGLAAMLVLAGHTIDIVFSAAGFPHSIATTCTYTGMTLFFVLSGSVMYLGYGNLSPFAWRSVLRFFGARFARLYPLYILTLPLYAGISVLHGKPIIVIASYLTLTQSWVNTMLYTYPPAWSISTECFFYTVFFIVFLPIRSWLVKFKWLPYILQPSDRIVKLWVCVVLIGLGIHILIFSNMLQIANWFAVLKNPSNTDISSWIRYFSPCTRLLEFILGIATGILIGSSDKRVLPLYLITGVGILLSGTLFLISLLSQPFYAYIQSNFLFAPILSAIIILSIRIPFIKNIFTSSLLVFSGKISYSLYLLQFVMMTTANALLTGTDSVTRVTKAGVIILFTYCIAYGSYQIIERPSQAAIRSIISRLVGARQKEKLPGPTIPIPVEN